MLWLLLAENYYLIRERIREIEKELKEKSFEIKKVSLLKENFQGLKIIFSQTSFFSKKRCFFLEDFFLIPSNFQKEILEKIEKFNKASSDIFLIFSEKNLIKEKEVLTILKKRAQKIEEISARESDFQDWLKNEFLKRALKVKEEVISEIISRVGRDYFALVTEIEKLENFVLEKKKIDLEDLEKLIPKKLELSIFQTIDFVLKKDKKSALKCYWNHLKDGESPFYILKMLIFHFRALFLLKIYQKINNYPAYLPRSFFLKVANDLNLHPFVVQKLWPLSQKFSFSQLKKIFNNLFQLDLKIKTGTILPEKGIEIFIATI